MASRRRNDLLDDMIEVFALVPWWVPVGLAAVAWVFVPPLGRAFVESPGFDHVWSSIRWLVMLALFGSAAVAWVEKGRRAKLVETSRTLDGLRALSWREFEQLCAEAYRRQGYQVADTPDGADGGVDLVLRKGRGTVLVQCKHYSKRQVGVRTIRELYGVMAADGVAEGIVITTGSFTRPALEFAKGKRLQLVDGPAVVALLRRDPTASTPSGDESGDTDAPPVRVATVPPPATSEPIAAAPRPNGSPGARVVCPSCSQTSPLGDAKPATWRCPACGWTRARAVGEPTSVPMDRIPETPSRDRDTDARHDLAQIDELLTAIEERRAGRPIPEALADAGTRLADVRSAISRGDWRTQQAANVAADRLVTLRSRLLPRAGARSDRHRFGTPGSVWAAPADGELHRHIGSVHRYDEDAPLK